MDEKVISSLKLVYKPVIMYYGEWDLGNGLADLALIKKDKNMFEEFLKRYYYMPLNVIFKDDELVKEFEYSICSRNGEGGRTLYFSKKTFLKNIVPDIEEILATYGDKAYTEIKKAIRIKKDVYRDVYNNQEDSIYYDDVRKEYIDCNLDVSFEEYVLNYKKKYTRLLSGYKAVLDLFDKAINVDSFIKCFNIDKLYLYTMYCLLKNSKEYYDLYGRLDYNINCIDSYQKQVEAIRKNEKFYNSYITFNDNGSVVVYTIDDLLKEYDDLIKKGSVM